jgi:hypothetical protein
MTGVRNVLRTQRVLGMMLAIGLVSTAASADIYVSGSVCTEAIASQGNVLDFNGGFARNPSASTFFISCPVPTDQNLGTTHSFEVRVEDNDANAFGNFTSWIGLVIGTNGEILSSSNSGQTSGTGELTMSFAATTGVASDDYSYVVLGNIPGNGSQVENLRIQ